MSSLSLINWTFTDELVTNYGPDVAYNAFLSKYKSLYDQAFPLSSTQNRRNKRAKQPWMTKALLKSCTKKSRLYKKYLRNPNDINKCTFVNYRNKFKQIRNECEATYYADCFLQCGNNLSQTWKIIKQILNSNDQSCLPDSFVIDGQLSEDPGDVANAFNDYFTNIGPNLASKIPKSNISFTKFMPNPPLCSFGLLPTSVQEVTKITNDLKTSTSSGSDDINSAIVKLSIAAIAAPLTNIINSSFSTGIFPNQLKIAKITPIYKSGDKSNINNYRPISVLPFFSKIFEKLMFNRVTEYLKKHCLLSPSQFGFQQGLSTYMALLEMQSNIVEAMDNGRFSLGIFFDLSKAFDTVNHGILLKKLENFGIRGFTQLWFTDYLSNRTQFVYFKGSNSQTTKITCGVPQGSILGPLLFLLFINDISMTSLVFKFILFADDTNVFLSNASLDVLFETANAELISIATWFNVNSLSLNLDKTNFILFHSIRKKPTGIGSLTLNNVLITEVVSTKFLGVIVDSHLTWSDHIMTISKKISKNIGVILRIRHCLPPHILVNLYYSLIFPYISYCNISWGSNYPSRLNHLFILQKRAIRTIFKIAWRTSTEQMFSTHKLLSLVNINKLQVLLFMYRFHHNLLPPSFKSYFSTGSMFHAYLTRNSGKYRCEAAHLKIKQFSIKCLGPTLWNKLPHELTVSRSIGIFKALLRKILISGEL